MNQEPKKSKLKTYIQSALLFTILLILPLGSWYYLSSGLNYQRSARAELKDYGATPAFRYFDQDDNLITQDSLNGKLVLISFLRPGTAGLEQRFETLKALHEQFDDRFLVWFVNLMLPAEAPSFDAAQFIEANNFSDPGQIHYLFGTEEQMKTFLKGIKMPDGGMEKNEEGMLSFDKNFDGGVEDYPFFVLIDKEGRIRNYYRADDKGQVKRLVEHMALSMPRE